MQKHIPWTRKQPVCNMCHLSLNWSVVKSFIIFSNSSFRECILLSIRSIVCPPNNGLFTQLYYCTFTSCIPFRSATSNYINSVLDLCYFFFFECEFTKWWVKHTRKQKQKQKQTKKSNTKLQITITINMKLHELFSKLI